MENTENQLAAESTLMELAARVQNMRRAQVLYDELDNYATGTGDPEIRRGADELLRTVMMLEEHVDEILSRVLTSEKERSS